MNEDQREPDGAASHERGSSSKETGGARVVLAARGLVAFELTLWPGGDAKELDLATERLAVQGYQLRVPVEAIIVELKLLVQRHIAARHPEFECRPLREHLVSVLIDAYYRASPADRPPTQLPEQP